jgi:RNase P subunit RPR2
MQICKECHQPITFKTAKIEFGSIGYWVDNQDDKATIIMQCNNCGHRQLVWIKFEIEESTRE